MADFAVQFNSLSEEATVAKHGNTPASLFEQPVRKEFVTVQKPIADPAEYNRALCDKILSGYYPLDILSVAMERLILDAQFLAFLRDISFEAANRFYDSVQDKAKLFSPSVPLDTRLELSEDFAGIFIKTANEHIASKSGDVERYSGYFQMPKITTFDEAPKPNGTVSHGRVFDTYFYISGMSFHIGLNVNDAIIQNNSPISQVVTMAHELGHVVDETFIGEAVRGGTIGVPKQLAGPVRTTTTTQRPYVNDPYNNYDAYRASIQEQHASLVENITQATFLTRAIQDGAIKDDHIAHEALFEAKNIVGNIFERSQVPTKSIKIPVPNSLPHSISSVFANEEKAPEYPAQDTRRPECPITHINLIRD